MKFYAYTHARPDGSIFYVGKGAARRAWDFSPRRRTAHHRNIAVKYGLKSILVHVYPAISEEEAFALERRIIRDLRTLGVALINLTDGGEGASGIKATGARVVAMAKGRLSWDDRGLSEDARARMLAGMLKGRPAMDAWRLSPEGMAHVRSIGVRSAAATAARDKRILACGSCGREFGTKSLKSVKWCSKACGQRGIRAEKKAKRPEDWATKQYSSNSTGRTGVYWNKVDDRWVAMIGVNRQLVFLGRFDEKDAAIAAREMAEIQYGRRFPRSCTGSIRSQA